MTRIFTLLTTVAAIAFVSPAFADAQEVQDDKQDIQGDIKAIHKDNVVYER